MTQRNIGEIITDIHDDVNQMTTDTMTLAKGELGKAASKAGIGSAWIAGAGYFAFLSVIVFVIAGAYGLVAAGLAPWLAFLIVATALLLLGALFVLLGVKTFKSITPPVKTQEAIFEGIKALTGKLLEDQNDSTPSSSSGSSDV